MILAVSWCGWCPVMQPAITATYTMANDEQILRNGQIGVISANLHHFDERMKFKIVLNSVLKRVKVYLVESVIHRSPGLLC